MSNKRYKQTEEYSNSATSAISQPYPRNLSSALPGFLENNPSATLDSHLRKNLGMAAAILSMDEPEPVKIISKDTPSTESIGFTPPDQVYETVTLSSQLFAEAKDEDSCTSNPGSLVVSPVIDSSISVEENTERFDELELPISSTVWNFTSTEYINGTDEDDPNIPKFPPLPLVPISDDSAAHKVFGTAELLEMILESCTYRDLLCRLPRVNKTWKAIIDKNKFIQQHLFFLPWEKNDYPWRWGQFNPFMFLLAYQTGEDSEPGCCYDFGMGPEEEDFSEDDGWTPGNHNRTIWMEFNWDKIKQDEKFNRAGTSWRRMLAVQPPTRELWFLRRDAGEQSRGNNVRPMYPPTKEGKRIGETWDNVRWYEEQPNCVRTKTFIRSSGALKRNRITVEISVEVKPIDNEEDLQVDRASLLDLPY